MTTEAEAVAGLVAKAGAIHEVLNGQGWKVITRPATSEVEVVDETRRMPLPFRSMGTVKVHDGASFIEALKLRQIGPVTVYADEEARKLTAILNDDRAADPGWRDYRVELSLRRTPQWAEWAKGSGQFYGQEPFAELIEERVTQIIDPAGAVMLELAQHMEGSVKASFEAGARLQSGSRQLVWKESISAKGGSGTIEIPDSFLFSVPLFLGAALTDIRALLRFRLSGGSLALGYKIVDLEMIELHAFNDIVAGVLADSEDLFTSLRGPAPAEA